MMNENKVLVPRGGLPELKRLNRLVESGNADPPIEYQWVTDACFPLFGSRP